MCTKVNGVVHSIYFPQKLDETIEVARKNLGMNRSRFVIYAVTKLLQELSLLSEKAHGETAFVTIDSEKEAPESNE